MSELIDALNLQEALETIERLGISYDIHCKVLDPGCTVYSCGTVPGVPCLPHYRGSMAIVIVIAVIYYMWYEVENDEYGRIKEELGIKIGIDKLSFNSANLFAKRLIEIKEERPAK